jgi:hypothetical protein
MLLKTWRHRYNISIEKAADILVLTKRHYLKLERANYSIKKNRDKAEPFKVYIDKEKQKRFKKGRLMKSKYFGCGLTYEQIQLRKQKKSCIQNGFKRERFIKLIEDYKFTIEDLIRETGIEKYNLINLIYKNKPYYRVSNRIYHKLWVLFGGLDSLEDILLESWEDRVRVGGFMDQLLRDGYDPYFQNRWIKD